MTEKIKLIPSYEAIMPLLLENYCRQSIDERETSLREVFEPLAKAADKYFELQEELQNV